MIRSAGKNIGANNSERTLKKWNIPQRAAGFRSGMSGSVRALFQFPGATYYSEMTQWISRLDHAGFGIALTCLSHNPTASQVRLAVIPAGYISRVSYHASQLSLWRTRMSFETHRDIYLRVERRRVGRVAAGHITSCGFAYAKGREDAADLVSARARGLETANGRVIPAVEFGLPSRQSPTLGAWRGEPSKRILPISARGSAVLDHRRFSDGPSSPRRQPGTGVGS